MPIDTAPITRETVAPQKVGCGGSCFCPERISRVLCCAVLLAVIAYPYSVDAQAISIEHDTGDAVNRPVEAVPNGDPGNLSAELEDVLRDELRERVEHRTMGIAEDEADLYYRLLHRSVRADYHQQQAAARDYREQRRAIIPRYRDNPNLEFQTFVDLFKNPEDYQGRLVTLRGHVQHIVSYPASENHFGIETLYEAWLYTSDSQQNPAVIVCTSLPEGLQPGSQLVDHVSVTGYFFKMYGYRARDTTRMAPMILASRLEWRPPPPAQPGVPPPLLYSVVVLVAAVSILLLWRMNRRDRRFREQRFNPPEKAPEVDLRDL
jgi:hypothetical protein